MNSAWRIFRQLAPALSLAPLAVAHAAETRRPNVVVLLADDLGYADLGCQGSADVPSPNIDSIATHGVRFTDAFGRETVDFIGRHRDQPFFLYVAFVPPHLPLEAKPEVLETFAHVSDLKRRTMLAMMASLDENVGRVLDKLRAEKLEEDTLVFFLSDNGGTPRKNASRNEPCRGWKGQMLEGGLRVPFLARWTGHLPAGEVYRQPISSLDILPTALAAAGVKAQPDWNLDGVNLLPYLTGKKLGAPHDALAWRFRGSAGPEFYDRWAIRQGDWKLVKTHGEPLGLYNLAADIGESDNLATVEPERFAAMKAAWDVWNKDNIEPFEFGEVAEQPPPPKPRKKRRPVIEPAS